jgi:hypothetical protein
MYAMTRIGYRYCSLERTNETALKVDRLLDGEELLGCIVVIIAAALAHPREVASSAPPAASPTQKLSGARGSSILDIFTTPHHPRLVRPAFDQLLLDPID